MDIRQIVEETLVAPMLEQAAQLRFQDNFKAIDAELTRLRALNAELVSHLKVIVHSYENTYDGDEKYPGHWVGAASIPVETMEAASRLLKRLK